MNYVARAMIQRMGGRPVLIHPAATTIVNDLVQAGAMSSSELQETSDRHVADVCMSVFGRDRDVSEKPFPFADGIALIPVSGTLVNRFSYNLGWLTGYNFIRSAVAAVEADDDVKSVVFYFDTHGGECAGCYETATIIKKLGESKPTYAVVDSNCHSAGYELASACNKIIVTPTGDVGSIGVRVMHIDASEAMGKLGYKITFVVAGDHKVDGNPYEALSAEVRANIQADVDTIYKSFVSTVASNRGMPEQAVRDTQARCYLAEEALSLGLIDVVAAPDEAVSMVYDELSSGSKFQLTTEDKAMSDAEKKGPEGSENPAKTQQAVDTDAARKAERERVAAIVGSEEANGRKELAEHLAFETDMSAEQALVLLAKSPTQADNKQTNQFQAAMDGSEHPEVGEGEGEQADANSADAIMSAFCQATGRKL